MQNEDAVAPIPDDLKQLKDIATGKYPNNKWDISWCLQCIDELIDRIAQAEQRAEKAEAERDEAAARIEALEKAPEELIFYAAGLIQEKYLLDARAALNPPEEPTDAKPVKGTP